MEARKLKNLLSVLRDAGVRVYRYKDSQCVVSIVLGEHNPEEPNWDKDPEMGPVSNDRGERAEYWSS